MAKLADALDLGSSGEIHGGSSPSMPTKPLEFLTKNVIMLIIKNLIKGGGNGDRLYKQS